MKYRASDGSLVEHERWGWIIEYRDGTELHQFDGINQKYNNFYSIDQTKIHSVTMHNFAGKTHRLLIPPGASFVHYYDNLITSDAKGLNRTRIYCFGYQAGDISKLFSILPDDSIVESTA